MDFMRKRMRKQVRLFADSMRSTYAEVESPYFKELMEYELAILQLNAFRSKKTLFRAHLEHKPILYQNDVYMAFFRQFFVRSSTRFLPGGPGL